MPLVAGPHADSPLRIAQVPPLWAGIPPATYGGIELVVHLLTEELVRRGHEVTLFATGESRDGGKVARGLRATCLFNMMEGGRASLYDYYANAAVSDALANAAEYDVVHFHTGMRWCRSRRSRARLRLTIHTILPMTKSGSRALPRRAARRASAAARCGNSAQAAGGRPGGL